MVKTVAFIPARYNSKRFPGKPLAVIGGKPMIQHVYQRSEACPDLNDLYVVTDDQRIYDCVEEFGGRAIMTDPDHRSGTDRIAEAVKKIGLASQDIVVNIQGDQPVFEPSMLSELVRPLAQDPALPMATLMHKIEEEQELLNPNHVKVVVDNHGYALYFSRLPIPFFRDEKIKTPHFKHLGFYAYRNQFLLRFSGLPSGTLENAEKLEQLRALEHGFKIKMAETAFDSIEVDKPEDLQRVEERLSQMNNPGQ